MAHISVNPRLRTNRAIQHRLQNAVRPNAATKVEPVAPIAPSTETLSNESANYLYEFERSSWVHKIKRNLPSFYQKERKLWQHLHDKRKNSYQLDRLIQAWNEVAQCIPALEDLGVTNQSKVRSHLQTHQHELASIGVDIQGIKLIRNKSIQNQQLESKLQTITAFLIKHYHHLFSVYLPVESSPYEQSFDPKGLIYEQRG